MFFLLVFAVGLSKLLMNFSAPSVVILSPDQTQKKDHKLFQ